ncbi:MAG: serine/threonine protein kinase, partial [Gemmataceae bacterium]
FRQEAETVARLQHPNIVQIFEVGEYVGGAYLVLELVDGGTLTSRIAGVPQPLGWSCQLMETVARAVHAMHDQRVIHRDLKPGNILLTPQLVPKIADFGLARSLDSSRGLTLTHDFLGTPAYMAPEQASGTNAAAIGPAADQYALGIILYQMITGQVPFTAEKLPDLFRQITDQEPLPPRLLRPECPKDLDTIIRKCLRKNPTDRYESTHALAEDLRRFQVGEPVVARPIHPLKWAVRWVRRNSAVSTLIGVVVGLLLAGVIAASLAAKTLQQQRDAAVAARNDALEAHREGDRKLWDSLVSQADANRLSRRAGQRFATLDRIAEAQALGPKLQLGEAEVLRMRNAAIGAFMLPDIHPVPEAERVQLPPDTLHYSVLPTANRLLTVGQGGTPVSVRNLTTREEEYAIAGTYDAVWSTLPEYAILREAGTARLKLFRLNPTDATAIGDVGTRLIHFGCWPAQNRLVVQDEDSVLREYDLPTAKLLHTH